MKPATGPGGFGWLIVAWLLVVPAVQAETLHVAVASNFRPTLEAVIRPWEQRTGHHVVISSGSTGKLATQIIQGAPWDVFLAADTRTPEMLESRGKVVPGSRFAYALGQLVLWSKDAEANPRQRLESGNFKKLAMANPRHAPYGRAAEEFLVTLGLEEKLKDKIVMGENVNQAFSFAATGHAELALVARSLVSLLPAGERGSFWLVPQDAYSPIEQQAVQLTRQPAAIQFLEWLQSKELRSQLTKFGYDTPHAE